MGRQSELEEAFEILGCGKETIDKDTLGIILRSLGLNPTQDEVNALFDKHKQSGEMGVVSVVAAAEEFEAMFKGKDHNSELKEAFSVFDKDNSGKISAAYALPVMPHPLALAITHIIDRCRVRHIHPRRAQGATSRHRKHWHHGR